MARAVRTYGAPNSAADIVTTEEYCNTHRRRVWRMSLGSDALWHTKRVNLTRHITDKA